MARSRWSRSRIPSALPVPGSRRVRIPGEFVYLPQTDYSSIDPGLVSAPVIDVNNTLANHAKADREADGKRLDVLGSAGKLAAVANASPDVAAEVGGVVAGLGLPSLGASLGQVRFPGSPPAMPGREDVSNGLASIIAMARRSNPYVDLHGATEFGLKTLNEMGMKAQLEAQAKRALIQAEFGARSEFELPYLRQKLEQEGQVERANYTAATPLHVARTAGTQGAITRGNQARLDAADKSYYARERFETNELDERGWNEVERKDEMGQNETFWDVEKAAGIEDERVRGTKERGEVDVDVAGRRESAVHGARTKGVEAQENVKTLAVGRRIGLKRDADKDVVDAKLKADMERLAKRLEFSEKLKASAIKHFGEMTKAMMRREADMAPGRVALEGEKAKARGQGLQQGKQMAERAKSPEHIAGAVALDAAKEAVENGGNPKEKFDAVYQEMLDAARRFADEVRPLSRNPEKDALLRGLMR